MSSEFNFLKPFLDSDRSFWNMFSVAASGAVSRASRHRADLLAGS